MDRVGPPALLVFALCRLLSSSLSKVIFGPAKCSHQQRSMINFSDWPALDIDLSNMIWPQRGGAGSSAGPPLVSDICS